MDGESCGNDKTRQREAIGDLLYSVASRPQSRRGDIGSAEVVHDTTDSDIGPSDNRLAGYKCLVVLVGISHLRHDGEESWSTRECEDERRYGGNSISERRIVDDLVVRLERPGLRRRSRAILNTHSNGDSED